MRVRRLPQFVSDVADAVIYLGDLNSMAATKLRSKVSAAVAHLRRFPRSGSLRHELGEDIRRWPVQGFDYAIYYRAQSDALVLLRLLHGRRNTDAGWFKEEE